MSSPTPLQSFVGGIGVALPVHALLVLNGSVFGISSFLHGAIRGRREAAISAAGLILGGVAVGVIEGAGPGPGVVGKQLWSVILSGLLVGVGTKMSNGCTSGHMIAGLSRFSLRSFVATATFFVSGVTTAGVLYRGSLPSVGPIDWTFEQHGTTFLALQAIPVTVSALLYVFAPPEVQPSDESKPFVKCNSTSTCSTGTGSAQSLPHMFFRSLAALSTSFNFALALRLSNLTDPMRVVTFLLPFDKAFDPSLCFVGLGALPLSILLYHTRRCGDKPRLGGEWKVPKSGAVDINLIAGAAIFGVGWGLSGICPGPGLINFGRAVSGGSEIISTTAWIASAVMGGLFL